MYVIACYFSYLAISIGLTIWVAHTLQNSGRVFLIEAFAAMKSLRIPLTVCWSSGSTSLMLDISRWH